jgi:hypothetical protein
MSVPGGAVPDPRFPDLYNQASFMFPHELSGNPLFQLPALMELADRRPPTNEFAYWSKGAIQVTDGWETRRAASQPLAQAIADIASNDSLVMLKRVEQDERFGPLLRDIFAWLIDAVGEKMRRDVIVGRGTLLIASPHRVTAYHIDADVNFLFQLSGDKKFSVFNQADRSVISDEELECYFSGDHNGARFTESKQASATTYDLRGGWAVHVPCMAPHWAQNLDSVSVALSVNFDLKSIGRIGRLYNMNRKLRRLGAKPRPPGASRWGDGVKLASLRVLQAVKGATGKRDTAGPY